MEQNIKDALDIQIESNLQKQKPEKELRRVFKGQTEFVLDYSTPEKLEASKIYRRFHQRMLRAYLKGATQFNFGFKGRGIDGRLVPEVFEVLQAWE